MSEEKKSDLTTLGEILPGSPIRSQAQVAEAEVDPAVVEKSVNSVADEVAAKGIERQQREDPTIFTK